MKINKPCNSYWDHFTGKLHQIGYRDKGIFHSEMFLFLAICRARAISWYVESGMRSGQSTKMIMEMTNMNLATFEKDNDDEIMATASEMAALYRDQWTYHYETDATKHMPMVVEQFAPIYGHTACLIDGPKGQPAIDLAQEMFKIQQVGVVAIHDQPESSLVQAPEDARVIHSHDVAFRQEYGDPIDTTMPIRWRNKYPKGPGLAIWVKV